MQLPILIEPVPGGFRAQVGEPFHVNAEAADARRAVDEVVRLVGARL